MRKKFLAWLMIVAMTVTMMPTSAFADTVETSASQIGNHFEVSDTTGALPATPTLSGETAQSYENGKVVVDKTIAGTAEENVFDVTLSVSTQEVIDESSSSPDAATVLVIDCSGSMSNNRKMSTAKTAAQTFINGFVAENATRKIAIVKFSGADPSEGSITGAQTVQPWTDAADIDTTNAQYYKCDAIDDLSANGGTNIQAGLILAKNLLNSDDIKDIENKNIILVSDGQPTYGVNATEAASTSEEIICQNGRNMTGTGYESDTECEQHEPVEDIVPVIQDMGVNTYAVYVGSSQIDCNECSLNKSGANWLGNDCGFTAYSAANVDTLVDVFESILRIIEMKAQAWIVTDPIGDVDFVGFNQEPNPVDEFTQEDGTITWDIKSGSIPEETTEGNVTTYTYTLSYKVKLDTLASDYEAGKAYAANGVTGLTYLVTETVDGVAEYTEGTAYFNVPSVKGFAGDLNFKKVGSLDEALPGAEFTLTKGDWSATATADANGNVVFEDVPSGHTFTLTETKTPDGYIGDKEAHNVTVSYGKVTVDGADDAAFVVKNESETIDIEGSKTWVDGSNAENTRPASITVNLLADGVLYDSKEVKGEGDEWTYTFTDLPKYNGGEKISYTVQEAAVNGYTTEVKDYAITNTIAQSKVSVSGTKTWIAPAGTEHPEITINLLQDGKKIDSQKLSNGTTSYTFADLDKYDLNTGKAYVYTVEEADVDGYTSKQEGTSFVNTIDQEKITVSGTKTWKDPEGTKHPSITINLLQDGKEIKEVVLTDGTTEYSFTDLDKYNLTDGHEYVYTVTEDPIEGYTSKKDENGNFINTINPGEMTISGVKTWIDPDGTKHPEITVQLLQNGEVFATKTLADGVTDYSFKVPVYDENGQPYEYEIAEIKVAGYTSAVSEEGYNITNTIEQAYVSVDGTKTWIAPEGTEVPDVTINLLQDGKEIDSVILKDGKTEYSFTQLPKYDLTDGHIYNYTVEEAAVEGYTSVQNGTAFTNTINQEYVSVNGTKTWIAPEGTDVPDVTIKLFQDGKEFQEVKLENGAGTYSFTQLPKYDLTDGHVYEYTVKEAAVEGYTSVQDGTAFTNTIEQDYVSVDGTKTWIVPEGTDVPDVTINLLQDGEEFKSVTLEDGKSEYSFTQLPKYDLEDGHIYEYTVDEADVAGYTSEQDGTDFVNTIGQDYVTVSGTKTWIDPEGTEHPTITINLLQDGKKIDSVELKNGTETYEFSNLDKYDLEDGHIYEYTVEEESVKGYTSKQDGTSFINTIEQDYVTVDGTKTWVDPKGTEHPTITIVLLQDGKEFKTTELKDGVTDYSFEKLPKYDLTDGHIFKYTVEEIDVEGYTSVKEGTDFINTIEQNFVTVEGTKTWVDPEGTEHPEITIVLMQDGKEFKTAVIEDGDTAYKFDKLPKYDLEDGHVYEYTVEELEVEGYTSVQKGTDFINTIEQAYVSVNGTKTWIAPEGTELPDVTINLLQDGKVIDSTVLKNGAEEYSFEDLDKYDLTDGHIYEYTVEEVDVEGYTSEQDGADFVNTIEQDKVTVSGTKTWKDPKGTEHPEITINLLQDGKEIKEVVLKDGETAYSFADLDKYDLTDGHEYVYTVTEDPINGYTSEKDENGNFINTINPGEKTIAGVKTWIDPDGTKHPEITVQLLQNGEVYKTQTLANGETEYSFTVPVYDGNGQPYEYEIAEIAVDGYTSVVSEEGYNITNTIVQEYVTVDGTKTWIDPEGTEHPAITIVLMQDGEEFKTIELADGETAYSFDKLPKYDLEDGHIYEYTVEEIDVEGYTSVQEGTDFINTIVQDYVTVDGSKTWIDPEGTEHPEITIVLLQDGEEYKTFELADGETEYSFGQLPKYDLEDGHIYEYTVEELAVDGYTSVQNGTDFVNTIEQDKTSVTVSKVWKDPEGTEHPEITINLLRDGEEVAEKVLANGTTEYTFTDLDVYDLTDGHIYEYTITEDAVTGYSSTIDGYVITNKIDQEKVSVEGTKTWIDPEGTEHPEITINLLQNGVVIETATLANGESEYSFTELDKYDDEGRLYAYAVSETLPAEIADKYNTEISEEGYDITNRIKQEKTIVSGTKTWIDPEGTEHPAITINLLKDGKEIKEVTLEPGTTTYSFEDLDMYDLTDGHIYEYTVTEDPVEGYTTSIDGTSIVNTIVQEYVSVSGTKTWKDPEGTVHPEITINLLRDGEEIDETVLSDGTTEYSFGQLPKYDLEDGHIYQYAVTEDPVEGYLSVKDGDSFINTIEPGKTTISGVKTWIDPEGTEHPTITINLLQNGTVIQSVELANGETEYSFDVPVYDSEGQPYTYEIAEASVEGYTPVVNEYNVTNTIVQEYVTVEGTKVWQAPEGTEFPAITINLLRDGEVVDSAVLENGTTEYSFAELPMYDLADGHIYNYTVTEDAVEGYVLSAQDGTTFVNTIAQRYVTVSGTKSWVAPEGTEFPEITVNLLKNGEEIDEIVLQNGETTFTFEGLEEFTYNEDGTVIVNEYTITEDPVKGYTSVVDGYNITNTKNPDPIIPTGDSFNIWMFAGLAIAALIAAIAALFVRRRNYEA